MVDGDALMVDGRAVEPDTFMDALDPVLPMAYRLARGFLRNADEAEDVLQEATLKAWKYRGSLRAGSPLRPWFLAIVANQCRQTMRARWWSVIRQPDVPSAAQHHAGVEPDEVETLRQALLRLPTADRLILVLRYYLDLSFQDVAATLHISTPAARVRTHRALARLRPIVAIPGELADE
jgi:RNA polymerase sigma-70 factor (ECF subfamily)